MMESIFFTANSVPIIFSSENFREIVLFYIILSDPPNNANFRKNEYTLLTCVSVIFILGVRSIMLFWEFSR